MSPLLEECNKLPFSSGPFTLEASLFALETPLSSQGLASSKSSLVSSSLCQNFSHCISPQFSGKFYIQKDSTLSNGRIWSGLLVSRLYGQCSTQSLKQIVCKFDGRHTETQQAARCERQPQGSARCPPAAAGARRAQFNVHSCTGCKESGRFDENLTRRVPCMMHPARVWFFPFTSAKWPSPSNWPLHVEVTAQISG